MTVIQIARVPAFIYWEAWVALATLLLANYFYVRWRNRQKQK
jgi:hypothetical protein